MAEFLGIKFQHHDALEDAKATGKILIAAIQESGVPLDEWEIRAYTPITPPKQGKSKAKQRSWDGNPEGHLFGKTIVFTRGLSMTRDIASQMAADAGCNVRNDVTSKTNWVVIGDDGLSADPENRTTKHQKALDKIEKGKDLQILCEAEFLSKIEGNKEDPESQQ